MKKSLLLCVGLLAFGSVQESGAMVGAGAAVLSHAAGPVLGFVGNAVALVGLDQVCLWLRQKKDEKTYPSWQSMQRAAKLKRYEYPADMVAQLAVWCAANLGRGAVYTVSPAAYVMLGFTSAIVRLTALLPPFKLRAIREKSDWTDIAKITSIQLAPAAVLISWIIAKRCSVI